MADKQIFSFLGGPGSGKGTLANNCKKMLGFEILSTGSLCRKHILLETDFGKVIGQYLKYNKLIPDELITNLVIDWLNLNLHKNDVLAIILDGYPRTKIQAISLLDYLAKVVNKYDFKVINFLASNDILLDRLKNRFVCLNENCQKIYHVSTKEVKMRICSNCGEKIIKRDDDKIEYINKRVEKYPLYRNELIDFYFDKKVEIYQLNAEQTTDEIFKDFKDNNLEILNSIN